MYPHLTCINRCGPCQRIAPFFEELSRRYPRAVFLKVDVDQCPETAASNGVTAMPTFIFFRSKVSFRMIFTADHAYIDKTFDIGKN